MSIRDASLRRLNAKLGEKVSGKLTVLWSDQYRTPRSVWAASAIAATLVHAGAIWWGVNHWQSRRSAMSPAPIQVIALPVESDTALMPAAPTASLPAMADASVPAGADNTDMPFEPVPPSDSGPPVVESVPAPSASPQSTSRPAEPVTPSPTTAEPYTPPVAPVSPTPLTNSEPSSATAPGSSGVAVPESPIDAERPFPVTTGEISPSDSGVQAFWTLQAVPGGSDLPAELPQIPAGWRESTSALLANSSCAAGLVAPGTSVRVTLWPVVEADGRISEFLSWDGGENFGKAAVVNCVEGLGPQMAPLIPASESGEAIASYAMLLVVEVQGIQ